MRFEFRVPGHERAVDSAVKKDGQWIGMFSGRSFEELKKDHPGVELVDKHQNKKHTMKR